MSRRRAAPAPPPATLHGTVHVDAIPPRAPAAARAPIMRCSALLLLAAQAAGILTSGRLSLPVSTPRFHAPAHPCASGRLASTALSRCMSAPKHLGSVRLRVRCSASDDEKDADASGLSSEFSRFVTPRVRVTQAWPVRVVTSAAADLRRSLRSVTRFYMPLFNSTPAHLQMLFMLLFAYVAQLLGGQASMYAGARINPLVLRGQWHRLFTPVLMHGSLTHILANCYSLWRIGPLATSFFGPERTWLIFLLSGVGGNLLGLWLGQARAISVGASGAVFGLMGCAAAYALRNKRTLGGGADAITTNIGQVLFINLLFGARGGSHIDNFAHLGGFASGGALGLALAPDLAQRELRGSLVPPAVIRFLLWATIVAFALSVRDAQRVLPIYRQMLSAR